MHFMFSSYSAKGNRNLSTIRYFTKRGARTRDSRKIEGWLRHLQQRALKKIIIKLIAVKSPSNHKCLTRNLTITFYSWTIICNPKNIILGDCFLQFFVIFRISDSSVTDLLLTRLDFANISNSYFSLTLVPWKLVTAFKSQFILNDVLSDRFIYQSGVSRFSNREDYTKTRISIWHNYCYECLAKFKNFLMCSFLELNFTKQTLALIWKFHSKKRYFNYRMWFILHYFVRVFWMLIIHIFLSFSKVLFYGN